MFNFIFEGKLGEYLAPVMPTNQLFLAIQHHRNSEVQNFILTNQCNYRTNSDSGYGAIHIACRYNNSYAIELLAAQGVSYEMADNQGNSTLHYAAKYGHVDLCRLLLERGCSPARKNAQMKTPYDLADSHTVRQFLLPLQLQAESASQQAAGPSLHPGIPFASSAPTPSLAPTYPPLASGVPSSSAHYPSPHLPSPQYQQQQPPSMPSAYESAGSYPSQPPLYGGHSTSTDIAQVPPRAQVPVSSLSSARVIKPDGFHSSASDPALQAKYGHIKQAINIAPPPTASAFGGQAPGSALTAGGSGGVPPPAYSIFASQPNSQGGPSVPPVYNRYVAYDAHTNSAVPPPPQPQSFAPTSVPTGPTGPIGGGFGAPVPPAILQGPQRGLPTLGGVAGLPAPVGIPAPPRAVPLPGVRPIQVFNPATDCDVVDANGSSNAVL